jgi:hypothetical protein
MRTFNYAPPRNAWTHVAVVASTSDTKLYVNGALHQTLGRVTLGTDARANTVIGGTGEGIGGDNDPFRGTIDELRIYNRALSATAHPANLQVEVVLRESQKICMGVVDKRPCIPRIGPQIPAWNPR